MCVLKLCSNFLQLGARMPDPYWKIPQRDIQGLLSEAVWYRFPLNQKSRSQAGLSYVKDRGTVCFLTVAPFKINGLMKTLCLHWKPRSISASVTSIMVLVWQRNPGTGWKSMSQPNPKRCNACVFSYLLHVEHQNVLSSSNVTTFLVSEDILAGPHNFNWVRVRECFICMKVLTKIEVYGCVYVSRMRGAILDLIPLLEQRTFQLTVKLLLNKSCNPEQAVHSPASLTSTRVYGLTGGGGGTKKAQALRNVSSSSEICRRASNYPCTLSVPWPQWNRARCS